jgi:hypothetical protein
MIKKNENSVRKLELIHRSNFKPIGIYSKLSKKQCHQFIPTKVNKTKMVYS